MGKKRIKIMGAEIAPEKTAKTGLPDETGRRLVKSGKEHGRITDMGAMALAEAEKREEKEKELAKLSAKSAKKSVKSAVAKKKKPTRKRGKKYLKAKKLVDRTKLYPLSEAIKLVKKTSLPRFNGSVEVHLVTREKGLKKEIKLPHRFDKQTRLKIATEAKAPLIHLVIGRIDSKEQSLAENFRAIIEAVGTKNIRKAVLTSTMGPGIKVAIDPAPTPLAGVDVGLNAR